MNRQTGAALLASLLLGVPAFAADEVGMGEMHGHMQKMQETMAAVRGETDAVRRQELMAQHHREMQEGMRMMEGSTQGMPMEQRMDLMEQRMGMMRMMMQQMMEHSAGEPASADSAADTEHEH